MVIPELNNDVGEKFEKLKISAKGQEPLNTLE